MARHVLMHVNYKYNVQDLAGHQDFKLDQEINCTIIFIFLARFCECLKHYNSYSNLYVIITLQKLSNVQEHELKDNSNGEKLLIDKFQMKFYLMI